MKTLVLGAGAVGCFYGSRISMHSKVSCVSRSSHDHVLNHGFTLKTTKWGEYTFIPDQIYKSTQDAGNDWDHIIISTKAVDSVQLIEMLKSCVSPKTMIHFIQNGIGIEIHVANAFPNNPITSAVTHLAASRMEYPWIVQQSGFDKLYIGMYRGNDQALLELESFVNIMRLGQLTVIGPLADVQEARWNKLMWNASFNPIAILAGEKNVEELLNLPETEMLIRQVMQEIVDIAQKLGYTFESTDYNTIDKWIEATRKVGAYKPSMLLDYENGRPLELEVILENPVNVAKEIGVSTPRLETLYSLLLCKTT